MKLNSTIAVFGMDDTPISYGWWPYFMTDIDRFGTDIDPNTPLSEDGVKDPEIIKKID